MFRCSVLLLMNFLGRFRFELMCISLILNIRSSLTHLYGFQLLVLLPQFIKITFFVCINRINIFNLKESSDQLAIVVTQSPPCPRNLALGTFSILLIVFSTKVNPLYLLYSTLTSDKAKLFHKMFSKTLILMT